MFILIIFLALLVTFAISFLGAFDINLPNTVTKADSASNKGDFSIFFMAFTLALVSFLVQVL